MTEAIDLAGRWEQLKQTGRVETPALFVPPPPHSGLYRPLADAADEFIRYAQSPHEQIHTGFQPIDRELRGVAPGELLMIMGFSHGGKTLALLHTLRHNRNRNVIYFCPDEPRALTLIKLACISSGMSALDLESRVRQDDEAAIQLLRDTANVEYPNLAVIDDSVGIPDMMRVTEEVSDLWGQRPDLVVFDYLQLLSGGGEDVPGKMNAIKAFGRREEVPLIVLHQTSRSSGAHGQELTIASSAYGGEQQATHIIGVRRKLFDIQDRLRELRRKLLGASRNIDEIRQDIASLEYDERIHQSTVTINLVKNKRVGGELIPDGLDYQIEQGTGRLRALQYGDLTTQMEF